MRSGGLAVSLAIVLASCGGRIASDATVDASAPQSSAPPPASTCGARQAPAGAPVLAIRLINMNLGDLDENGSLSDEAWRTIGFDIDGLCTARGAAGSCAPGGSFVTQEDGELGIDNAFGKSILPVLGTLAPDISRSSAGKSYLRVDGDRTGTLVLRDAVHGDFTIVVPLMDVRIDGDERSGTMSALVPAEAFLATMRDFCDPTVNGALARAIRQAADARMAGANVDAPCDALSLGMTYVGIGADVFPSETTSRCR